MCQKSRGFGIPSGNLLEAPRSDDLTQEAISMHRRRERKRASARRFNKGARKTHRKNISIMRGGWRL